MVHLDRVAVVGAGIVGCATALYLTRAGVDVDVLDKAPGPDARGSGITMQGNGLRILRDLGLWEKALAHGFPFDTLGLRAPGPDATVLAELEDIRTGGPDLPATLGIVRAQLAVLMRDELARLGVPVRYGTTVTGIEDHGDRVSVTTVASGTEASDEESSTDYDLVIGADGLHSTVRRLIGKDVEVNPVGMGIWRSIVPRPAEVVRTDLYYGGPAYIAGYCPIDEHTMYAYFVEDAQHREQSEGLEAMRGYCRAYGGPWNHVAASLDEDTLINYTQFTHHLVENGWNTGRVVLAGDAVHSCPPTIAQGAAMGLEDAAVLVEELVRARDSSSSEVAVRADGSAEAAAGSEVLQAAFDRYVERRLPRARAVVESSLQLARWQLEGNRDGDAVGLINSVSHLVATPA